MFGDLSEEEIEAIMDEVDEQQLKDAVGFVARRYAAPLLAQIRERAEQYPDNMEVRGQIDDLPPEKKEELFYDELHELIFLFVEMREDPEGSLEELQTKMRDPHTLESLLLIFENEDHIDTQYTDQLRDFVAAHLHYAGALALPEMYSEEEVRAALQRFDIDPDQGPVNVEHAEHAEQ